MSLSDEFVDILQTIVEAAIDKGGLAGVKKHLSAVCPGASEEIKDITEDHGLIGYYRNYSHLFNFDLLKRLVNSKKFGLSYFKKDLEKLSKEVDQFYEDTKVSDFIEHIGSTVTAPHGQEKVGVF